MARTSRSHLVIRHKAKECVGCCLCTETAPQYFEMDGCGLASLLDSRREGLFQRATALRLDQVDLEAAAEGCPVDIIRLDPS